MFLCPLLTTVCFSSVYGSFECVSAIAKCNRQVIPIDKEGRLQCRSSQQYYACYRNIPAGCPFSTTIDKVRQKCVETCMHMRIPVTDDCKPTSVTSLPNTTTVVTMTTVSPTGGASSDTNSQVLPSSMLVHISGNESSHYSQSNGISNNKTTPTALFSSSKDNFYRSKCLERKWLFHLVTVFLAAFII